MGGVLSARLDLAVDRLLDGRCFFGLNSFRSLSQDLEILLAYDKLVLECLDFVLKPLFVVLQLLGPAFEAISRFVGLYKLILQLLLGHYILHDL